MENWITIILICLFCTAAIVGLAALWGVALLGSAKRYRQKQAAQDAKKIEKWLPGTDCGDCSCQTCKCFAEEVAWQAERLPECPHLSDENRAQIEALLTENEALHRARQETDKRAREQSRFLD